MANPYHQVGLRIRRFRRQAQLTQAKLAEKAGLSDNFVGIIERGAARPTLQTIDRLADALGVKLADLFGGVEEEPKSTDQVVAELESLLKERDVEDAQLLLSITRSIFERFPMRRRR